MATTIDLPLRRNKTHVWDGVAKKRVNNVWDEIDLTGATTRFTIRRSKGEPDPPLLQIVSGSPTADGRIDHDPDQTTNRGEYTLRIEHAATDDESEFPDDEQGYYPFEIEVTEASGERTLLADGYMKYSPDVR